MRQVKNIQINYAQNNRLNYSSLKLFSETGKPLGLLSKLRQLKKGGDSAEWACAIRSSDD